MYAPPQVAPAPSQKATWAITTHLILFTSNSIHSAQSDKHYSLTSFAPVISAEKAYLEHLYVAEITMFPFSGISRTQSAVAVSTPEADMSAGNTGVVNLGAGPGDPGARGR